MKAVCLLLQEGLCPGYRCGRCHNLCRCAECQEGSSNEIPANVRKHNSTIGAGLIIAGVILTAIVAAMWG